MCVSVPFQCFCGGVHRKTEIPKGRSGDDVERGGLFSKRGGKRASAIIVRGYI